MKKFFVYVAAMTFAVTGFGQSDRAVEARAAKRLQSRGFDATQFRVNRTFTDNLGHQHTVFDQVADGVKVLQSQIVTQELPGGSFAAERGDVRLQNINVNGKPSISTADAIASARSSFGEYGFATSELVVVPRANGNAYQLAYRVDITNTIESDAFGYAVSDNPRREFILIDAHNGATIERMNNLQTGIGTGAGYYAGSVADLYISGSGTTYYLNDTITANGTASYNSRTTDLNNRQSGSGTIYTSGTTKFGSDGSLANRASIGVDAHWFAQKTLDYFLAKHGRDGIDNKSNTTIGSGYMLSRTHYGRNYNNAFWNGSSMTYGDGDGTSFNPFDSVDVVGHEMTHGITERTSNLAYNNESGAANESFSDIFGVAVEFYTGSRTGFGGKVYATDWKIGEDLYKSGTGMIRDMANPPTKNDPDFYKETGFWEFTSADNYGVHTNSGVQNKVFYLLSVGGQNVHRDAAGAVVTTHTTINVTALGIDAAAKIAFRADTVNLVGLSGATYAQNRAAWIKSANELDTTGAWAVQVANAWSACGVN